MMVPYICIQSQQHAQPQLLTRFAAKSQKFPWINYNKYITVDKWYSSVYLNPELDQETYLFSASSQTELEDLGMLCIQLATKVLFHCGFHTKKTLRWVALSLSWPLVPVFICGLQSPVLMKSWEHKHWCKRLFVLLAKIFLPGVQPMTGLKHYTRTYCTAAGYGDGLWTLCLYSTERDFVNTSWSLPPLRWSSVVWHFMLCLLLSYAYEFKNVKLP